MANILIIDDDVNLAQSVKSHLEQHGHACDTEATASDVMDKIRTRQFDLLILDVMLPGVSGFEVCRRIRRDETFYTLPILIMSAMKSEEEVFHGLAQGADDYMAKPFDVTQLAQRVDALLRSHLAMDSAKDDLTALPNADATKREVQRLISNDKSFALVHCELFALREFGKEHGADARSKAIRHVGRLLSQCVEELAKDKGFVGHMGGGHFLAILPVNKTKNLCKWVIKVWQGHVTKLLRSLNISNLEQAGKDLDVMLCATTRQANDTVTPKDLFDTLSRLRNMALGHSEAGVYFDRRSHLS